MTLLTYNFLLVFIVTSYTALTCIASHDTVSTAAFGQSLKTHLFSAYQHV